jgi:thioredoxin 1
MTDEMYLATKADFDDAIAATNGGKPLIIDFTASWCPPCKMIAPKFQDLANENSEVTFKKVDVDANAEAAQAAGINCMPTFKCYKGGAELADKKIEGANLEKIQALVAELKA